ncbi:MAG: TetR/AcrR family transcriptional regulator, partial [Mariprofundaceae bacterium]|nr:TetR/AcrR family transcriptional regulator [Mariprofundaceae bacterium]
DRIRHQILEAAAHRFADYGYGKTTVAEIARDCDMSSGNVYRYFASKEAIAIAGVQEKLEEKSATCEATTDVSAPAIEQLRQYLLARLRFTHTFSCGGCHLHELVQLITERHHHLIDKYDARVIDWLTRIIERGIENGEFRPQDARQTASSISVATVGFCVPIFMQEELAGMEAKLNALLALLHQGLKA